MKVYYENETSLDSLKNKKIAILGYGSQGHAHALNLKESGMDVIIAEVKGGDAWNKASEAGFEVLEAADAVKTATIIMILLPDQIQKKVYDDAIVTNLKDGDTLVFAHGFNIHYKQIVPPANVYVF
jgi:ketol-acid reductoisomerase